MGAVTVTVTVAATVAVRAEEAEESQKSSETAQVLARAMVQVLVLETPCTQFRQRQAGICWSSHTGTTRHCSPEPTALPSRPTKPRRWAP